MKEFLILAGSIVIWVLVAKYLSRTFIKKGNKPWLSKFSGVCVGAVAALAFLVAFIPTQDKEVSVQEVSTEIKETPKSHDGCLETYKADGSSEWNCENKGAPAPAPAPQDKAETKKQVEKYFDITPQEFAKRINVNLTKNDVPFRLKIKIQSGEVNNTFNHSFNERIGLAGSVDKKTGLLTGITIITSGDGTTESGLNVMAVVISAYSAVLGENTMGTGEPAKIMMKLMEHYQNEPETSQEVILNGVKFGFVPSQQFGNWFLAQPL